MNVHGGSIRTRAVLQDTISGSNTIYDIKSKEGYAPYN